MTAPREKAETQPIPPWTKTEWQLEAIGLARDNAALRAQVAEHRAALVEAERMLSTIASRGTAAGMLSNKKAAFDDIVSMAWVGIDAARAALARVTA